jgi:pimeloyl-ACP methyl ester carboxylesterase
VNYHNTNPLMVRGKVRARTAAESIAAVNLIRRRLPRLRAPLLVMVGTEDKLVDRASADLVIELVGSTDRTLKRYVGLSHEILNEPEKEVVLGDLVQWLKDHEMTAASSRAVVGSAAGSASARGSAAGSTARSATSPSSSCLLSRPNGSSASGSAGCTRPASTTGHCGTSMSGPTILLVYGLGSSWFAWAANLEDLARDHRVIAVDLPGSGISDPPPWSRDLGPFAADVVELLERTDATPVTCGRPLAGRGHH